MARPSSDDGGRIPRGGFRHVAVWLTGPGADEAAIPHATALAGAFGGRLTMLRVLAARGEGDQPADPLEWDMARREARGDLERLAAAGPVGLSVETAVLEGDAATAVPRWVDTHGADLVVLCCGAGLSGHRAIARTLLDDVPGSVLVVRAGAHRAADTTPYRRLLVPVDGSARAESVLPVAVQVAAHTGAELLVAHVVPEPGLTTVGPLDREDLELLDRVNRRNVRVATAYLDRLRTRLSADTARLRVIVLRGGDVRTLLERAVHDENVDLVVMSSHGHSGRITTPYGSVTADLVLGSPVPVLVVRPGAAHVGGRDAAGAATRLPRRAAP